MSKQGKKKSTKMSLNDFLGPQAPSGPSWADDIELPTAPAASGDGSRSGGYGGRGSDDVRPRPEDIPTRGPFTAYVGNLPFDVTEDDLHAFFTGCGVSSVRIPMNHDTQRPKGYCYVEFRDRDSLIKGLDYHGKDIRNRSLRINLAEQKEGAEDKTSGNWRRQGGSNHENEGPKPADTSNSWRRAGPPPVRENGFAPLSSDRFGRDGQEVRGPPKFSQADNVSSWRSSGTPRTPTGAFESRRNDSSSAPETNSAPSGERKRLVLQPRSKPLE